MDWGSRGTSQSSGTSTPGTSESMLEIQSIPSSVTASPRGPKESNASIVPEGSSTEGKKKCLFRFL